MLLHSRFFFLFFQIDLSDGFWLIYSSAVRLRSFESRALESFRLDTLVLLSYLQTSCIWALLEFHLFFIFHLYKCSDLTLWLHVLRQAINSRKVLQARLALLWRGTKTVEELSKNWDLSRGHSLVHSDEKRSYYNAKKMHWETQITSVKRSSNVVWRGARHIEGFAWDVVCRCLLG